MDDRSIYIALLIESIAFEKDKERMIKELKKVIVLFKNLIKQLKENPNKKDDPKAKEEITDFIKLFNLIDEINEDNIILTESDLELLSKLENDDPKKI